MKNEMQPMQLAAHDIIVQPGMVKFMKYEKLKKEAAALADQIKTVEVNDENLKQSKKLLAEVNKRVKELEDNRISIKKQLLESYVLFEEQIKEIVSIVKEADETVRIQVKQLEEHERAEKHGILEELFQKRIIHYSFRDLFSFKDFLKPKHLNKTASIEAVEKEMVEYLEKLTMDLKVIEAMPNSNEVLTAYVDLKDLAAALNQVNQQDQKRKAVEASQAVKLQPTEDKIAYLVTVKCYNQKELKLLDLLLAEHAYEFTVDKIYN